MKHIKGKVKHKGRNSQLQNEDLESVWSTLSGKGQRNCAKCKCFSKCDVIGSDFDPNVVKRMSNYV